MCSHLTDPSEPLAQDDRHQPLGAPDGQGSPDARSTDAILQRFAVPYEYPVYFTERAFQPDNATLASAVQRLEPHRRHRLYVAIDAGVAQAWPRLTEAIRAYVAARSSTLELVTAPEVFAGGEAAKNDPAAYERLQQRMHALGIDRHCHLIAIGGGAFLDMAGYAAATVHRGVRLVRMPTTVLGQNDSGIGVKNGVNAFGVKNFLGSFAPPFAVINDSQFLRTLGTRDRISGMAEAVKVGLIRDAAFFSWLEAHAEALARFETQPVGRMIRRAAELHLQHISGSGDPFERGSARPLDFGHWAAHKLEAMTQHRLRHGEAVAIGMVLDSRYSSQAGMLSMEALGRICALLERLGFRLWDPALDQRDDNGRPTVLRGLEEFREHLGGELTVTLLGDIGRGVEVHSVDADGVLQALDWLRGRNTVGCT